ncbi:MULTISPECIES: universal stress protein [Achromobacter]|uniref:Universal stress protein UspA n=1 Tax=Achromobacter spanius TaxID=217203 RepID=A0AAW3IA68_9BURK|nr:MULTISPECIES: universal stress protein [Achromobacter]AZS79463.1 universal stress protein [Achromobacter spanius]KNE29729.1 universal stress protein UspA [Achromobacter spanius]MCD0497433.1 universal stress protein [Achromobacter sp. MY14]MCW3152707.1 universal stress protein [Achromobacter spanius]
MNTIILATDGSTYSDEAARYLVATPLLNRDFVVHVVHCEPEVPGDVRAFISKDEVDAWHHEESGKAMRSVVDILRSGNINFECHEMIGFTPGKIVDYAARVKANAIVLGSHHRSPLINALMGSVSGRILAHAPCPVLVI